MSKKHYGTQIWPFREDFGKDMPTTLEKLAKLGFAGVELCRWFNWTDMFDKWSAEELRDVAQRVGLTLMSAHIPSYMLQPEKLDELVKFCDTIGMKYVMVASLSKEEMATKASLLAVAEAFNQAADALKPNGIRIGFHAHGPDFKQVEGAVPWEILFDNTVPDVVMQMDIGNCMQGGGDPIHYLKKYPGRAALVHLKEYSGEKPPEAIGDGVVDWAEVFEVCEELHQPVWYIIEQEEKEYNPWISAEKSLEYLRALGW
ncbi:sugar phosphate isomerase/epimerase family protein [Chloroflexota bacterium]